ncbi:hypothetical protein L1887_34390 [Cichorium endivia]|nr:hypothetical protein L1887_34390 [Cichorium endivia]
MYKQSLFMPPITTLLQLFLTIHGASMSYLLVYASHSDESDNSNICSFNVHSKAITLKSYPTELSLTAWISEQTYLGRVIGAIVIVAGLYLVIWGKSKDTKLSTLPIGEQIALEKQIITEYEEDCCHKVTVKVSKEDKVCEKNNQRGDVC